ncbi:MAG: DUF1573 domain-containing protein [Bacteroidales bacterium]|nr:DUF1573 domain-containing protein [Bacteroidales bacterium]
MKRIFLSIIMILAATLCWAAAKITFTKTTHDFGTIQEKNGDATVEFPFTNSGDSPLLIVRAQSSCGCTVPEFPKKPIRPGESGVIKVTYHAKGRPGPFQKSVYVYDNNNGKSMLVINGNVVSNTTPEDTYATEMGAGLRVKNRTLNFFDVYPNRNNRTRTLMFYNESNEPIQLTFRGVSKNVHLDKEPEIIQPKKEGRVLVTFLTKESKDWGMHTETFDVFVKGKESKAKNNRITLQADIWEDFSELSRKERDNAPEIEAESTTINFGKNEGKMVTKNVEVWNTGKTKLTIRKVQNDMPKVFKASISSTTIKPGDRAILTVSFHPEMTKLKTINHHITLISNDPSNSRVIINLQAD